MEFGRKEKTKAQKEAEDSKQLFVEEAVALAGFYANELKDNGREFNDYFYLVESNGNGVDLSKYSEIIQGSVMFEPDVDFAKNGWKPEFRIIFDNIGRVYYQPLNYKNLEPYKKICFPVEELDKYEIKTTHNSLVFIETMRALVQDKLEQTNGRKLGKQALSLS